MKRVIKVMDDARTLFHGAGEEFVRIGNRAVAERGVFAVVLSGGTTPRGLFSLLATEREFHERILWRKTHFFWGDERYVPPDNPQSNYGMAMEAMLSRVEVPRENIHRVRTELAEPEEAAQVYEREIRDFFRLKQGEWPCFDLILLGMGPDGHTASLFPGTRALGESKRLVVANWVEKLRAWRITMTLPVLNAAKTVLFLVAGTEKAEMVRRVLERDSGEVLPAQLVQPKAGELIWMLDQEAARSAGVRLMINVK